LHDATAAAVLIAIALLPVAIWIVLLTARGGFWRVGPNLAPRGLPPPPVRKIAVVIPARDEAAVISDTLVSLQNQDYDSSAVHIYVVDDNSSDGTAERARSAVPGAVTVIGGKPLPAGWTGKLWALSQGITAALETGPDYLLFTDADIRHDPHSLATLIAIAETQQYDLVSFMVKLSCSTAAEKLLIPAFVFFFFQLYPPAWIRDKNMRTAGAAGGCVLIRPGALRGIGGIAAIRGEVIDDCALARAVKRSGGRVWLGLTPATVSTRTYERFGDVGAMISRTAFNQLRHSALLLTGTVFGLVVTFLLPLALLFNGFTLAAILGAIAYGLMTIAYTPMVRFYCLPIWRAALLPVAAFFYMGATIASAIRYWRGVGGNWKGRAQDVAGQ
jgi:hopene-associated glycosyltransferase HpnB